MKLHTTPKEKREFLATYKKLVMKILEKRAEKGVLEEPLPKLIDEQILALLQNLSLQYKSIGLFLHPPQINAVTRKIFIPYEDLEKNLEGIKDAGKYSILMDLKEVADTTSFEDNGIYINRISKKTKEDFIHPHVSSARKPCWGFTPRKELIKNLMRNAQLLDVLICIHDFLTKVSFATCYANSKADFLMLKDRKEPEE